jgi:hypothetical protein
MRPFLVILALLASVTAASAVDVTGKWTSEQHGRGGFVTTYALKADGAQLTGTVTSPEFNRGIGEPQPFEISNGRIDGDKVSFEITPVGGNLSVVKYDFTIQGEDMVGKTIFPPMKVGTARIRNVVVKRVKE